MNEKRIRIVDIAEKLGVSTATVSNVIHGKTKKISDETVKRVQELLEKKQYIPSMAGILLAQNSSRIVGVVVNDHEKYESRVLEDNFISSSLNYLSNELEQAGYFMMVKVTKEWGEIAKFASMWNMEGMVIIGFCEQDYKKLRDKMHIPFVVYDGYLTEPGRMSNLVIDNYDGGFQMGNYFRMSGHKNVLCISDNDVCMDLERFKGFKDGMESNTGSICKAEGQNLQSETNNIVDFMLIPMEKEKRMLFYQQNLEQLKSYTAIFAVSDYYAIDLMQFLWGNGIRVPDEISVAGFDDCPACEMVYPGLTTIRQNGKQRAMMAISMLNKLRDKEESGETITLPVTLVERKSVRKI